MKYSAEFRLPPDILRSLPLSRPLLGILPLDGRFSLSVGTGRMALAQALSSLPPSRMTGRAWLPSLCCASLAPPFLRRGFRLLFYSDPLRSPPPELLPGDVFLYIHFCGFPNRPVEEALRSLPAESRPVIIEDCVHALFTRGVGTFGDFALYSFRKFLPVPDGGLLTSRLPLDGKLAPPLESYISVKTAGLMTGKPAFLRQGEAALDSDDDPREPSAMGNLLLDRLPWEHIPAARRKNYSFLAGQLALPALQDGTVPLGAPVRAESGKAELERLLRAGGFEPPLSWDAPPDAPSNEAGRLVILPCDERLEDRDLETLSEICLGWRGSHGLFST